MLNTLIPVHFSAKKPAVDPMAGKEWKGSYSAVSAGTKVLTTTAEWKDFWENTMSGEVPKGFDPKKQFAVVIGLGPRRSGGFGVSIVSARESEGKFYVDYRENTPQGMVTMATTQPYLVKLFPKTTLPVVVRKFDAAI